jgi:predicted permease
MTTRTLQDARFGLRILMKAPVLTLVAALTLALGTGANTAIFTIVNFVLLRPLPVRAPDQLVVLAYQQKKGDLRSAFSYPNFQDIRTQSETVFTEAAASQLGIDGLTVKNKASRVVTAYVTGNYFTMLGLHAKLGRLLLPSEGFVAGADPVLVLGYSFWKNQLGGDTNLIGAKASFDGRPITIVGVAPETFHGTFSMLESQVYLPLGMATLSTQPPDFMENRELRSFSVMGRLRSGITIKKAGSMLDVVAQRIAHEHAKSEEGLSLSLYPEPSARPQPQLSSQVAGLSGFVLFMAVLVLTLACVNVANIMLVRTVTRQNEIAIRAALGAKRTRLIRQLLTESILLALLGGGLGILLGRLLSGLVQAIPFHTDLPVMLDFGFDWRVFGYGFGAILLTGIVVGMLPALQASRTNLNRALREGGRGLAAGRHRIRNVIVVAEVAGSLTLVIVAGLFVRSFQKAQHVDIGFVPDQVINLSMDPHEIGYSETEGLAFYRKLLQTVRALPGVRSASLASSVPMGYYFNSATIEVMDYTPPPGQALPSVVYNTVSPGYFETMGIPILRGRSFTDADDQNARQVAIINQAMADRYWPHQDPMGMTFKIASDTTRVIEVVGIAKNSRYQLVGSNTSPFFYLPVTQNYNSYLTLQVLAAAGPEAMVPELLDNIKAFAPDLPVFDVRTMTEALNTMNGLMAFRIAAVLTGGLGLLGFTLALVGTYGIVSNAVTQRSREIGIRISLGAQSWDILKMIFREGFIVVGLGLGFGLVGAWALAHLVQGFLVGVSPSDPAIFAGVSVILGLVTLGACYLPARSALRVDPVIVLRDE